MKWVLAVREVGEDKMAFKLPKPTFFKESIQGYKTGSPDINEPKLKIPGNDITMKGVEFPVHGKDNLGNEKIMEPGKNYEFSGDYVIETPLKQTYKPPKENYVYPEDWDETFLDDNQLAHYNANTNEINYKFAPPPYKDVVMPSDHVKKHETIHSLQEHEEGKGSNIKRFDADVKLAMSNFKKNYKGYKTRDPDPTNAEWRAMSDEELRNWKPTYSYKRWEDLSLSKQKSEYAKALKQFKTRDIYITPGTIEHEAEQRSKLHGPGYYKEKFSKKK